MDSKWCLLFNFITYAVTASMFIKGYLKGRHRLQHAFVFYFDCAQKFIFKLVEIETA